ncbi:hypothetical protein RLEG3_08155 (plasmid) [Rhizobium leguminosarum bv. trifolii WSM1689]|nr:hypothetical protein RLEG3_08155 [Rhizobium leguminosarum bv. trifolii WSM1689]
MRMSLMPRDAARDFVSSDVMTAVANPLLLRESAPDAGKGITMREVNSGRRALSNRAFGREMQNANGGTTEPLR